MRHDLLEASDYNFRVDLIDVVTWIDELIMIYLHGVINPKKEIIKVWLMDLMEEGYLKARLIEQHHKLSC